MNKLILSVFMLLAVSKSNGQRIKTDTMTTIKRSDTPSLAFYSKAKWVPSAFDSWGKPQSIYFMRDAGKTSAYLTPPSDTLYIMDTVIELYNNKIRYIKIGNKVYPLKTN